MQFPREEHQKTIYEIETKTSKQTRSKRDNEDSSHSNLRRS